MKTSFLPLFLFLTLGFFNLNAQENSEAISIGFKDKIKSEILGEDRPLLIHLPNGYEESKRSYPVIYLMDGGGHFHHTTGTMNFLSRNDRMPQMIIVGIPNTKDRTHDLTPPETGERKQFPTSGGADNTLQFIAEELAPYINEKYRTTDFKLLIGHSFGGLFAIHALANHPDLFDAYLAISPSLWWDDQKLVDQVEKFLEENPKHEAKLYMTMGDEGGSMLGGYWKLAGVLEEKASENFQWETKRMTEETHGSVPHRSTYYGFESLFKEYHVKDLLSVYNNGGLDAIQAHYDKMDKIYGSGEKSAPEGMMNSLGYYLMSNKKLDEAIAAFKYNVKHYPDSYNVYDSLGEALKEKGDKEGAIKHYKKSVELNPGNTNGIKMLKEMGVEDVKKEYQLSDKQLSAYVGTYQVQVGMELYITKKDGALYGRPSDAEERRLVPVSESEFYVAEENIKVNFHFEDKKITAVTVTVAGGQVMKATKVK